MLGALIGWCGVGKRLVGSGDVQTAWTSDAGNSASRRNGMVRGGAGIQGS